jgi:hypothetical protein
MVDSVKKSPQGRLESPQNLQSLQTKLARVLDIFEALLSNPPAAELWPEWLGRATALLSQYETVLREVRPALGKFLIIPDMIGDGLIDRIPNILLRTRLIPEVEQKLDELSSENEVGGILKVVAQVLQESASELRIASRMIPTPIPQTEDLLIQSVKAYYTI